MPKLKISDRERQNRTLIAIIQSGKEMEDISVQKLAKLTGISQSTLYQRLSEPEDMRIGELRDILRVLKITELEKERIGRRDFGNTEYREQSNRFKKSKRGIRRI